MRRLVRVLAILLVVAAVIGGLLVADTWSRDAAERRVTELVAAQLDGGTIDTRIGGWPFLLARFTNRMESVEVTISEAMFTAGEISGMVDQVTVLAREVGPSDDPAGTVAGDLDASVTLGWERLSSLLGVPIEWLDDDRLAARTTVSILGVDAEVVVQAAVLIEPDGTLLLSDPVATAAGVELPDELVQLALDHMAPRLRLPAVPDLAYDGLEVGESGVTVRLTGQDVPLAALA